MAVPFYNDYVIKNKYSRPALKLLSVKGIVIHYTANKGATAENHQDYFDGSDGGGSRYAGAHIFVDSDSAVCIIPLNEVAYHANEKPSKLSQFKATASYYTGGNANLVTIGIEMCIEKDGSFHPNTVKRTQEIVKYLMDLYNVPVSNVVRHYDVTGKICPKPYVDSPTAWNNFKKGLTSSTAKTSTSSTKTYTVKKGDTLWGISQVKGVSVANLKSYNGLKSDTIQIGQVLKLTKGSTSASKPKAKYTLPTGILKKGDKGTKVTQLQKALVAVNFYPDKKAKNKGVDGIFGKDTLDAVKRFQSVYANPVDGIYGSKTRLALDRLLNK